MIYFIQAGEDGPVKIGRAKDPVARLAGLQTGSSERLYIRAVLDEPDECEEYLHDILDAVRVKGEWFRIEMSTLCVMACAMAGFVYRPNCMGGPNVIELPAECRSGRGFDRTAYQREYMREYRKRKKEG